MAIKDFRADRIRISKLIGSSSLSGTPWVQFYSASNASDFDGGVADSNMLSSVGQEVGFFVSGSKDGRENAVLGSVALFGGDLVVSGTIYAEKQIIEVEESTTGSFTVSGSLFVSGAAGIGLTRHESIRAGLGYPYRLHVENDQGAGVVLTRFNNTIVSGDELGKISFGGTEDGIAYSGSSASVIGKAAGNWDLAGNVTPSKLEFYTTPAASNVSEKRLEITKEGNVNINTTGGAGKLEIKVDDSDGIKGLVIDMDDTVTAQVGLLVDSESDHSSIASYGKYAGYFEQDRSGGYGIRVVRELNEAGSEPLVKIEDNENANEQTALWVKQAGIGDILNLYDDGSQVFTVADGGHVGIGSTVTSPDHPLEIVTSDTGLPGNIALKVSNTADDCTILSDAATNKTPKFSLSENGTFKWSIQSDANDGNFWIRDEVNARTPVAVEATGNVSIGTTNAAPAKLVIDNSLQADGTTVLIRANASSSGSIAFGKSGTGATGAALVYDDSENLVLVQSGSNKSILFKQDTIGGSSFKIDGNGANNAVTRLLLSGGAYFKETAITPSHSSDEIVLYAKDDGGVTKLYFSNADGESGLGGGWDTGAGFVYTETTTDSVAIGSNLLPSAKLQVQDLTTDGSTILVRSSTSSSGSLAFAKTATGTTVAAVVCDDSENLILVHSGAGGSIGFKQADATTLPSFKIKSDGAVSSRTRLLLSGGTYFKDLPSGLAPQQNGELSLYAKDDGGVSKLYLSNSAGEQQLATSGEAGGWADLGSYVKLSDTNDKVAIGRAVPAAKLDIQDLGTDGSTVLIRAASNRSGSLAFAKAVDGVTAAGISFGPNEDLLIFNSGSNKTIGLQVNSDSNPSLLINAEAGVDAKRRLLLSGGTYFKEQAVDLTPAASNEVALYAKDDSGVTKLYFRNSDGISKIDASNFEKNGSNVYPIDAATTNILIGGTAPISSDTILTSDGGAIFNEQGNSSDFRIESNNKQNAFVVKGSTDQVLILSGGGSTSGDEAAGLDVSFYVSGAIGSRGLSNRGAAIFGGDVVHSGSVTILDPGGSDENLRLVRGPSGNNYILFEDSDGTDRGQIYSNGAHLFLRANTNDLIFRAGTKNVVRMNGSLERVGIGNNVINPSHILHVSGTESQAFRVDTGDKENSIVAEGNQVLILSGGGESSVDEAKASDIAFYVSGSRNSLGNPFRGASLFGGDLAASGAFAVSGSITDLYNSNSGLQFGWNGHADSVTLKAGNVNVISRDAGGVPESIAVNTDGNAISYVVKTNSKLAFVSLAATNAVLVNSDNASENGGDTSFWVSGSIGSKDTAYRGTACFGGDLHVSGNISVSGSVSMKTTYITHHSFNATSTARTFIPFGGYSDNSSSTIRYQQSWVAPFSGRLVKFLFRPFLDMSGEGITGSLHVGVDGTNNMNITPIEDVRIDVTAGANSTTTFAFTGSNHFTSGDWLSVSYLAPDGAGPGANGCNVTCVWELDPE